MTVAGVPRCHVADSSVFRGAAGRLLDTSRQALKSIASLGILLALWAVAPAAAQQPACATVPEAGRSCVDVIVVPPAPRNQARTGGGSFTTDDEPGNDASGLNHVIRSLDTLTYEVRYRVLNQDATGVRLRFTLPAGAEFAAPASPAFGNLPVPAYCAAGSTLTGNVLDCLVGPVTQGVTRSVLLQARPKFGTVDGTVIRLQAGIEASNQQSTGAVVRSGYQDPLTEATISCDVTRLGTTVSLAPCGDVVSARARFDLEMGGFATASLTDRSARSPDLLSVALNSSITTVVGGAAGRAGYVLSLPVAIALPGDGAGAAPLTGAAAIALTMQLSNDDLLSGFGELVGCGVNGNDDPIPGGTRVDAGWAVGATSPASLRARRHPYGTVGLAGATTEYAAQNSGQMSCGQSVAGGDISINLVPAADTFNPATFASRNVDGSSTARRYVFVGLVVLFYPADRVLTPSSGGTGDGAVNVRFNIGQLNGGTLQALRINGIDEPDAVAINNGFAPAGSYDDDNNNFVNATLDSVGATYAKLWRNPRADTATFQSATCLKDGFDPHCRHGYAFPGSNIQSLFIYNYRDFVARQDAAFCDEWDSARTRLRVPFDAQANAVEMPPGHALLLELGGANSSSDVLSAMGISVEVSTDAGTVANVDWEPVEPARSLARSQASAPECSSGTWTPATLPAVLGGNLNPVTLPAALESPPGSGIYPAIKRIRIRANSLAPYITVGLRGSYEVLATVPGTRLPNRTSFRFGQAGGWTYAENDHAIVRSADTSIQLAASRNLTTGALAPVSVIGFGETVEHTVNVKFSSGELAPVPAATPLIVKVYLPAGLDYVAGSSVPALFQPAYSGVNPETMQPATVLEWQLAAPVAGVTQPPLTYQVRLATNVGNGASLHTSATVQHALDPGPLFILPVSSSAEDRLAVSDIVASVPAGLLATMSAAPPFIDLGGTTSWQLGVLNNTDAQFSSLRIVSPLPRVGDLVNSSNSFAGDFSAGQITGLMAGATAYYTLSAAAQINRDPNCTSNGGTLPDGVGACPAAGAVWVVSPTGVLPSSVTAIRIDESNALPPNTVRTYGLSLVTANNRAGDVYENSFVATAPGQTLVVQSPRARIAVPAGQLRGAVFSDNDNSHSPTPADTGISGVTITLTGRDQHGNSYRMTVQTASAGTSASVGNQVSINGAAAYLQSCAASPALQAGEFMFCNLPSADAAGYTLFEQQPAGYLDREDYVGVLASGQTPGSISANDTLSGIRLQNNLQTGAADHGTGYLFSEYPIFANITGRVFAEQSWPLNQTDDGVAVDPGLATALSISCSPASTGSSTTTSAADGRFEFTGIPVGATCTVTESLPAGYINHYNLRGTGAFADTGASGSGPSTLAIVVPAGGSHGNAFAELQLTDTTSSVVCSPQFPATGQAVICTITCINHGPAPALNMTCEATNLGGVANVRGGSCASTEPVAVGDLMTCKVQFPMPASLSEIRGGSGALNDANGGPVATAGNNPSATPLAPSVALAVPVEVPIAPTTLPILSALLALFASAARRERSGTRRS